MTPMPQPKEAFDADAYLAWEEKNEIRHEYLEGEVFAMAGAKEGHVTVALNLAVLLRNHLRGGPCRVFISDMKLRVEAVDAFFYPDVMVSCHPDDRGEGRALFKKSPALVAEVLSDSTAAFDRGRKFAGYRRIPELREYLLIDPDALEVECYRRGDDDHWVLYPFTAGERVELTSVGLSFPIEALYEDVDLPEERPLPPDPRERMEME